MIHCTIKVLGILALLFLVSSPIKAQTHACGGAPAGSEVQVGEAPGGNGLAPTPLCDWVNGNQSQGRQPAPPPAQWATQWGAIATDGRGHLGAVTGLSSKSDAQHAAISDCQAKGGSQCLVDVAYDNECAAMVVGHPGYNVNADATPDKAIMAAMRSCSAAGNTNCHVYYTACSLPVRIQ